MFSFRSLQEIEDASVTAVLRRVARDALTRLVDTGYPYNPDVDGYVVLSGDTGDDPELASLLGRPFPEVLLEGVDYDREALCVVADFLSNNEFSCPKWQPSRHCRRNIGSGRNKNAPYCNLLLLTQHSRIHHIRIYSKPCLMP